MSANPAVLSNLLLIPDHKQSHEDLLEEIGTYITQNLLNHPLMQEDIQSISVLLGGSTALGVLDEQSDVDLLVFCEDEKFEGIHRRYEEARLIPEGSDFFVDVRLPCGKTGHYTLHPKSELLKGLARGEMEWLWFSHVAYTFHDSLQLQLILSGHVPIQSDFLYKLRKNTYIELRTFAKGLDNPVTREEKLPILFFAVEVFKAALRCAIVIEGYPYPYDKWLERVARNLPVGKRVLECSEDFFQYLKDENSFKPMYQEDNSFVRMEKRMRKVLLKEFRSCNLDEPWLIEWWKYVEK